MGELSALITGEFALNFLDRCSPGKQLDIFLANEYIHEKNDVVKRLFEKETYVFSSTTEPNFPEPE